jgi:hypothetical protein
MTYTVGSFLNVGSVFLNNFQLRDSLDNAFCALCVAQQPLSCTEHTVGSR